MKINFINTIIPEAAFRKQYELGSLMIYHIGEALNKELGAYECYECSIAVSSFDEEEVQKAFVKFTSKIDALKLKQAKVNKIAEIAAYDTSDKVNGFILNGQIVWLDKATRVGLMNSTTIERDLGQETTELWLGEHNLIIKCDLAIQLLQQLEVYALKCFNVTATHKKEVNSLSTIEEINSYDITKDYPDKLVINI